MGRITIHTRFSTLPYHQEAARCRVGRFSFLTLRPIAEPPPFQSQFSQPLADRSIVRPLRGIAEGLWQARLKHRNPTQVLGLPTWLACTLNSNRCRHDMARFFGLILAATFAIPTMAVAQSERVRGTIESVEQNSMTVQTLQGGKVKVALTDATKYVAVVKSSLSNVAKGASSARRRREAATSRSPWRSWFSRHQCAVRVKAIMAGTRCRTRRWRVAAASRAA
jgi:hypothetical protein